MQPMQTDQYPHQLTDRTDACKKSLTNEGTSKDATALVNNVSNWYRERESNPHGQLSPRDFKSHIYTLIDIRCKPYFYFIINNLC